MLKKPLKEQREAIDDAIVRSLHAFPALVAGEMDKATLLIHTIDARPSKETAILGERCPALYHRWIGSGKSAQEPCSTQRVRPDAA